MHIVVRFHSTRLLDRFNHLGIQMLPEKLHSIVFPNSSRQPTAEQVESAKSVLGKFDLLGKVQDPLPLVDFDWPKLVGSDLKEHFQTLGTEQSEPFLSKSKEFTNATIPSPSIKWQKIPGWTRYEAGKPPEPVKYPLEDKLVFDVEVLMPQGPFPVVATAVSDKAWYGWLSPELFDEIPFKSLIPLDTNTKKIVIGHHISFDRSKILEEYSLKASNTFFIDTMSLHCAVGGLSSQQRPSWSAYKKTRALTKKSEFENIHEKEYYEAKLEEQEKPWIKVTSLNSLQDAALLHLNISICKDSRKIFEKGTKQMVLDNFDQVMDYCANDVHVTWKLFATLLPKFLLKCPHPVSFAGLVQMSRPLLTVNDEWNEYLKRADAAMEEHQLQIESNLLKAANDALESKEKSDPWLSSLDWTVKVDRVPKLKDPEKLAKRLKKYNALLGKPQWFRDLWDSKECKIKLTTSKRVAPYLLKLQYSNYPVYHSKKYGWTFKVPKTNPFKQDPLHFSENPQDNTFDPIASLDTYNFYYKIPHKDGPDSNCGNPLGKNYVQEFENGVLKSEYRAASDILKRTVLCNYWNGSRQRIIEQFVVWQGENNLIEPVKGHQCKRLGIILPHLVPMGTITRRSVESTWMAAANAKSNKIGSEVKAMIKPPDGYCFVGADVDAQELWIASLVGDAQFGIHGASPFGFMTLQGSKQNHTDLHSRTAKLLGTSRDIAKIFNYARIYGAGVRYAVQLLKQCDPQSDAATLHQKAVKLYAETKGIKGKSMKFKEAFWHGGSESFMFNALEKIIREKVPRTPTLGCAIPDGLMPANVRDDFLTSRVNWVVQSSGVDYLHLLLVSMDYLRRKMDIDIRFMLSIHDEVHFLAKKEHRYLAALALQISNLWTRAFFCHQLGINELPLSVAFFSSVDIDHCFRKEVYMDCVTPSHPNPIDPGVSTDIYDTISRIDSNVFVKDVPVGTLNSSVTTDSSTSTKVAFDLDWIKAQMAKTNKELRK